MPEYTPRHPTVNIVRPETNAHADPGVSSYLGTGKSDRLSNPAFPSTPAKEPWHVMVRQTAMLSNAVGMAPLFQEEGEEAQDGQAEAQSYWGFPDRTGVDGLYTVGENNYLDKLAEDGARVNHPDGAYNLPSPIGPSLSVLRGVSEKQMVEDEKATVISKFSFGDEEFEATTANFLNPSDYSIHWWIGGVALTVARPAMGIGTHGQPNPTSEDN